MKRLDSIKLKPVKETNAKIEEMGFKPLTDAVTAKEFLRRPEVSYQDVVTFIGPAAEDLDDKIIELIETEIKYEGYISKAMDQVAKMKRMEENAFQLILIGMILILSQPKPVRSSNLSIQKPSAKPAVFRE